MNLGMIFSGNWREPKMLLAREIRMGARNER